MDTLNVESLIENAPTFLILEIIHIDLECEQWCMSLSTKLFDMIVMRVQPFGRYRILFRILLLLIQLFVTNDLNEVVLTFTKDRLL